MTTVQYISIIFAVAIMVVGLYIIIRSIKKQKETRLDTEQSLIHEKNGIPIVPRHQRRIAEDKQQEGDLKQQPLLHANNEQQSETQEANLAFQQTNSQFQTISEGDYAPEYGDVKAPHHMPVQGQYDRQTQNQSLLASNTQVVDITQAAGNRTEVRLKAIDECEDDVFSSLASATEKLMPVIETVEEPEFIENSPMLDQHLLAEADHDQNSPLNHAQENINITLIPVNEYEAIEGKKILALVKQYGLKYGAMNMFHRYEHKDGSGILWFSMMGITEDGIAPFDLNVLPTSRFNGLVLFLSLPHPKAIQGFDSMMSVVNLISNDLNALVLDENNEILTRERRHQLRTQVEQYQAARQRL